MGRAQRNERNICSEGAVAWARASDLILCTEPCFDDSQCYAGERCRILVQRGLPVAGDVFAGDLEPDALDVVADVEPAGEYPPCVNGCEEPKLGRPMPTVGVCDPLPEEGAVLSQADLDALDEAVQSDAVQ